MIGGLSQETQAEICCILTRHKEVNKAVLFGSRAIGNHRYNSDIDLALFGSTRLTFQKFLGVANALDESFIPYTFDVLLFKNISSKRLTGHIKKDGLVLYKRKRGQ